MKILIATDGSEFSDAAVEKCCRMVIDPVTENIKVISVFEQPLALMAAPYAFPVQYNPEIEDGLREQAVQAAAQAEQKIRTCFPDLKKNLTTDVLCGSPNQAIVEEAENWGADLIIVGSHGRGFFGRMMLGSVSDAVIHHAPCSVLVVRKKTVPA
jgi:nucleotide-binding universal stress UspA family protein